MEIRSNSTYELLTGHGIPILGLGTWQLSEKPVETIRHAISLGYRLIDTSSDYGTQPAVGKAVKKSEKSREELYIETKIEEDDKPYSASEAYVQEMQMPSADMIVIHRPPETGAGVDLWQGLIRAREAGLTKDIGVSNYSASQIQELIDATGIIPSLNQIEWSPFGHSMDMLDFCREKKILLQAYSPLTRGKRLDDETLTKLAKKYEKSPAQILIRWNLQLGTLPIPKANQQSHLEENINVFNFEISEEDMRRLSNLNQHYSSLGELPYV